MNRGLGLLLPPQFTVLTPSVELLLQQLPIGLTAHADYAGICTFSSIPVKSICPSIQLVALGTYSFDNSLEGHFFVGFLKTWSRLSVMNLSFQ